MFTGLHNIDWVGMQHAYGPARNVPELLVGLASDDAAEREIALDGMYGAVHHQGGVYDSTIACIPFLFELLADRTRPDRGPVVELLASIGGADHEFGDRHAHEDEDEEDTARRANHRQAHTMVRDRTEEFSELLADPDPEVRRAAAGTLAGLDRDPAHVLALLQERLSEEPDTEVRLAFVAAAGTLAVRHAETTSDAARWLAGLLADAADPGLRLAALAQLARCAPARLPDGIVPTVIALLRDIQTTATPGRVAADPRPPTPTLIGRLRELQAPYRDGRADAWTDGLLRTLHTALGDRVTERTALLTDQLRNPDRGRRVDAVWQSSGLVHGWRGSYEELVTLLGQQLGESERGLRHAASTVLEDFFELAAPAADALAEQVMAEPDLWNGDHTPELSALRSMARTLARLGDARALPCLAAALDQPDIPREVPHLLGYLSPQATSLVPELRHRLGRVQPESATLYEEAEPLLTALGAVGGTEALPEILRLLRGSVRAQQWRVVREVLRALEGFGPAAADAAPDLRPLLQSADAGISLAAAAALWSVDPAPEAVLPVLRSHLRRRDPQERRPVVHILAGLGPAAAKTSGHLRRMMLADDDLWLQVECATALWHITGDAEAALPTLLNAWTQNHHTRTAIAACLADIGPAAVPALPALRTELAAARRHNSATGVHGSHDIDTDETLLMRCRTAVDAINGHPRSGKQG
jgi:hypothetical protein